ncbi:MAG: C40 family peptidase [Bacteroidales bacterium]|nr:C40 family peptidase [Bacteroidales bacterium]
MTNYAICLLSSIPIRETASHRSEIVSQLLFGELCLIEDQYQDWYKIRVQFDNYEGWVDKKQLRLIDEKTYNQIVNQSVKTYVNAPVAFVHSETGEIPVLLGSSLPLFENGKFQIENEIWTFEGAEDYQCSRQTPERISFWALKYMKSPYLWGGRSPFGIDCSGLVQNVFRMCGYSLPRDAAQQAENGQVVNLITEAKPGDLLFFDNAEGQIIHVGILVGNNQIIHACGEVRMDKIDHQGIFNEDLGTYTHKLRIIKRLA